MDTAFHTDDKRKTTSEETMTHDEDMDTFIAIAIFVTVSEYRLSAAASEAS